MTRDELIAKYKAGYDEVTRALAGADEAALDRRPGPGTWSARQIVHHLAESETIGSIRLRRLLAEDAPVIAAYDQEQYAARLHYDRPVAGSLEAFRVTRAWTGELLDRLTEAEWQRSGTHTESGPLGVERWLDIYAGHAHKHADQIRRAIDSRT